ncbi:MAG: tetratricopeptide repeat protein [Planctomycetaceae bacterium]
MTAWCNDFRCVTPPRRVLLVVGWSVAMLLGPAPAADDVQRRTDSTGADLISKLLDLGLIDTASRICDQHLADSQSDADENAKWLIESSRTKIAALLRDDLAAAPERRDQATEAIDRFLVNHPNHPRELWLRLQRELVEFADNRRAVLMAVVKPADDPVREEIARRIIRTSSRMQELSKAVEDAVAIERSQRPDSVRAAELVALALVIANRRIESVMLRGELFAEGSDDYVASANESLAASRALLDSLPPEAEGRSELVKQFAESLRRTGELEQAAEAIAQLLEASPNDDEARALMVRIALDLGDLDRAAQALEDAGQRDSSSSEEIDLAHLQLAIAKATKQPSAKSQSEIGDWIERIGKRHGDYARRRAEQRALALGSDTPTPLDPRIVIARGASLLREGKAHVAAEWLAAATRANDDPSAAFQIAIAGAAAYRYANNVAGAASLLREVSLTHFKHADAAKLHLQAALLSADKASPDSLIEHLEECVATWPQANAAASATDWLIRLHEARSDWLAAAAAATNEDPALMTPERVRHAGTRWQRAIQAAPTAEREALAMQAVDAFGRQGADASSQSVMEELAVLFGDRERLSSIPAAASKDHWAHWLRTIRQGAAAAPIPQLEEIDEATRAAAVERLLADGEASAINRGALADAILALSQSRPSLAVAQAYDWKSDWQRAESILTALQQQHPSDLDVAKASAELLARSRDPAAKRAGLQRWIRLAGQLHQGSDQWHDAKLAAIELMHSLGDHAEAKRLAGYVLLTQPPSDPAVASRYRKVADD